MNNIVQRDIEKMLEGMSTAWNVGSLERFCGFYSPSAVYVTNAGHATGRDRISSKYARAFTQPRKASNLTLRMLDFQTSQEMSMCSAVLQWTLENEGRRTEKGYSVITVNRGHNGALQILHDCST
ncbi:MAG: nuclear transport factor 2 family protein [Patescibacteria group bacterium]